MAKYFQDLKLPEGYFTHILIDEASQMLECEALIALGLAGPYTRVVLAGDHMQMGPKLFSVDEHHRSDHTLLTRLFHYYQGQKCDAAQSSRIIFNENYRSTKQIVEFVSTHFYVGRNDIITAVGNIPGPKSDCALKFYHVRGECVLDTMWMSWYNKEESAKVVEEVKEILEHWPINWGAKNPSSICVLSEGSQVSKMYITSMITSLSMQTSCILFYILLSVMIGIINVSKMFPMVQISCGLQVRLIRMELRKIGLPEVNVENIANVQGNFNSP